ncbi:LamG domain-containing protein, partial [bacterium]|nr:LamG domain-containing protein [bacterium]
MRRILLGTLALMVLSWMSFGSANAETCPEWMISYWKFDEGAGTNASDSIGANDGTIYGATWATGKVGNALSFDGRNDQVLLPSINGFPLGDSPRTVVAWVNPSVDEGYKPVFDYGDNSVDRLFSIILSPSFKHGRCTPGPSNRILVASWYDDICSDGVVPKSAWTHIAVAYKGSGDIDFYINGQYDSSAFFDSPLNTQHYTGRPQAIGGRDSYVWFAGLIDEVAIYNGALSASEIQQHYDNGLQGLGYCASSALSVEIDIKPGSYPNSINLKNKGVIPVAILTTEDFDATSVDGTTVTFGRDGAKPIHGGGHLEDVNDDDKLDWVGH